MPCLEMCLKFMLSLNDLNPNSGKPVVVLGSHFVTVLIV